MATSTNDLRETFETYRTVRARLIKDENLALHLAGSSNTVSKVYDLDRETGGQRTVLHLFGTSRDMYLQLSVAISTMTDIEDSNRREGIGR